jgi:hypothetical protein
MTVTTPPAAVLELGEDAGWALFEEQAASRTMPSARVPTTFLTAFLTARPPN